MFGRQKEVWVEENEAKIGKSKNQRLAHCDK